jgi:hypothetical protein
VSNSPSNRIGTAFISISKALHEDDGSSMDTDDNNDEVRNNSMSADIDTRVMDDISQVQDDKLLLYHMKLAGRLLLLLAVILVFPWIQSDARV